MEEKDFQKVGKITIVDTAMDMQKFTDLHNRVNEIKEKFFDGISNIDYRSCTSRSAWSKIKTFFRFSQEIISSERIEYEKNGQKHVLWKYRVRVVSPDGLFTEAESICSSEETICKDKPEYVISDLAHTRAYNKAISDMVGIADEYTEEYVDRKEKMKEVLGLGLGGGLGLGLGLGLESPFALDSAPNQTGIQSKTPNIENRIFDKTETEIQLDSELEEKIKGEDSSSDKSFRTQLMKKMTELMNLRGMISPQEKRDYSQRVLKRPLKSSSELSIEEIKFITKVLEETP